MNNFFSDFVELVKNNYPKKKQIGLHEPVFLGNEKKYLNEAVDSTYVSSVGEFVSSVESKIEKFNNSKKAIAVVNGTSALQTCLKLVGVEQGDEVLTQSFSFVATSNAISYLNAFPVYIDISEDNLGLCPNKLNNFLENNVIIKNRKPINKLSGRKISACLPMHTFGLICDIEKIVQICNKWNIPVVEDAAEAFGSSFKNKMAGNFGKISAFSFNGNKILTSGGGGVIVTNDISLGKKAKHLTTTAKVNHPWQFFHDDIGYNFRMPNINAALLNAQLENFDFILRRKKENFNRYVDFFKNNSIEIIKPNLKTKWNHWLFSLKFENEKNRNSWLMELNNLGINARPPWILTYKLPMYKNCIRDNQILSNEFSKRILNIPSGV